MSDAIEVRPFVDDDLPDVLGLLRRSLGESAVLARTPELFRWKHLDNPFGRSIMLVACAGDRVVGFRALMRWELVGPGGIHLRAVRAVDTATDPDFQRRGIFRTLTLGAVDEASGDGVDLVFNTPNPRSGAGYLTMGWQQVGDIGIMATPGRGLLRRRPDAASLPDMTDFVPGAVTVGALAPVDRSPLGLRTARTPEYAAWRFSGHPTASYAAVSRGGSTAVVRANVRNGLRELVVSDLWGPDPGGALRSARQAGRSHYLAGWFSPGSPERRAAVRRGLLPVPRMRALTLVARPLRTLPVPVDDLAHWDLALSDLELL